MKKENLKEVLINRSVQDIKKAFGSPIVFARFVSTCFTAMEIFETKFEAPDDAHKSLRKNTRPIFADLLFLTSNHWDDEAMFNTCLCCMGIDHGVEEFYQQICYAYALMMMWNAVVNVDEYDSGLHTQFKALITAANNLSDYRIDIKQKKEN